MSSEMISHPRGTWLDPNTGKLMDSPAFLRKIAEKQVVMLGESHNIAEIHRWQVDTANYLHAYRLNMMMGFEMFPRRIQPVLDEWVDGHLTTEAFLEKVDWFSVWGFPPEIYLPLFHFCRQQGVRILALSCYRELASRVGKEGWAAIPEDERDGLPPNAPALPRHKDYILSLTGGKIMKEGRVEKATQPSLESEDGHPITGRFLRAQQTWGRAFACNMVHAINNAKKEGKEAPLIVGIIGRGHLDYGFGTPHQLNSLGITDTAVLLSSENDCHNLEEINGIGAGIFRLDRVEAPIPIEKREKKAASS